MSFYPFRLPVILNATGAYRELFSTILTAFLRGRYALESRLWTVRGCYRDRIQWTRRRLKAGLQTKFQI
jgi:hypothetical protein